MRMQSWEAVTSVDAPEQHARGRRVLVVDEHESISRSLTEVFARAGHLVVAVSSAEEGMHALQWGTFDCLVLDFRLPDLRGDVFYGFARLGQPQLVGRTVFVTSDATDVSAELMQRCKCPVFRPPFDVGELLAVVDEMTGAVGRGSGRSLEA
jgi:DNA-binding NtrC family response regulator